MSVGWRSSCLTGRRLILLHGARSRAVVGKCVSSQPVTAATGRRMGLGRTG